MNSEQFHRFTAESSSKEILPVLSNASIATCDNESSKELCERIKVSKRIRYQNLFLLWLQKTLLKFLSPIARNGTFKVYGTI